MRAIAPRFVFDVAGFLLGMLPLALCVAFGYINEIAIGRRSEILGIDNDFAKIMAKLDVLNLGKLGFKVEKLLHFMLVEFFGISSTEASGMPLATASIVLLVILGLIGLLVSRSLK